MSKKNSTSKSVLIQKVPGYLDSSDNTPNIKYLYLNNVLNYIALHNKATATCWFGSAPGMVTINQTIMLECHPAPKFKGV